MPRPRAAQRQCSPGAAPTVSEAFERFKRACQDLDPGRWDASPGDPHDAPRATSTQSPGPASTRRALPVLTEREREVLSLLAEGKNNREIAELLHVSIGTLKTHVSNILPKLRVGDAAQAVLRTRDAGLVRGERRHDV